MFITSKIFCFNEHQGWTQLGTFYVYTSYIPQEKKNVYWNFKNTFAQLCGRSQWAQSNADQVKGNFSAVRWSNLVEEKRQIKPEMINSIFYTFPRKNNKIIKKNFENALAPLCAPIQCRSISIKGNAVQCWIDLWCSEVKRTGWQKKGRVLLLKIMPLFCYFRRITIGSSPFWEWSKSQQALAEALGPILTKNWPKTVSPLL